MKKITLYGLSFTLAAVLVFGVLPAAYAGKGGNGNGFLEGPHFNLNLLGKKSDLDAGGYFKCPSPENYQFVWWKDESALDGGDCAVVDGAENEWCISCDPDVDGVAGEGGVCIKGAAKGRNVIHVPRDNDTDNDGVPDRDISMIMTSGASGTAKGGRKKSLTDDQSDWCTTVGGCLEVTDWCTRHFPDDGTTPASPDPADGGDGAAFTLPANDRGYRVLARVMGRPVEGDAFQFLKPSIKDLRDEFGNTLFDAEGYSYLDLGTINPDGSCTDANGEDNPDCMLKRSDNGPGQKGKKGVQDATELSALFQFSGDICYVNDTSCQYCFKITGPDNDLENGQFCDPNDNTTWLGGTDCIYTCDTPFSNNASGYSGADGSVPDFVCCFGWDENPEGDGNYYVDKDGKLCDPTVPGNTQCELADADDSCGDPANYDCRIDAAAYIDQYVCDTSKTKCQVDSDCPDGETCEFAQTGCAAGNEVAPECRSYEDIWVFNVADFVNVLMEMKTSGAYIVQLRFYLIQ